jgi:hypothetical protein
VITVTELVGKILAAAPELDEPTAERIARQLLVWISAEPERPVDARGVADFLGLEKTDWVYRHARELGGFTLGRGKKPRWRFLLSEIPARLRALQNGEPGRTGEEWRANLKPRSARRPAEQGTTPSGAPLLDFEAA